MEVAKPLTTQEMRLLSMDGLNDGRGRFVSCVCCCHCGQSILATLDLHSLLVNYAFTVAEYFILQFPRITKN